MSRTITRTQFLRGDFTNQRRVIRPPWAYDEQKFQQKCTQCNQCIQHCPEAILVADDKGYPKVNFAKGECTLCHTCVDHCEVEALSQDLDRAPWTLKAEIDLTRCLVYQGVHCMVCREQCEPEAITFTHRAGLPPVPDMNTSACYGCGACYKPCPGQAIKITYQNDVTNQHQPTQNKEKAS